jgi:hypothetical protein
MSEGPVKGGMQRVRQAAFTLVLVAVAARICWEFLVPLVPILVSFIVVLVVLGVAVFGRHK